MWFKTKKRYFIVNYAADGGVRGQMTMIGHNCFLGQKKTIEIIKEENPNFKNLSVIVTGIIELKENDYKNWCEY